MMLGSFVMSLRYFIVAFFLSTALFSANSTEIRPLECYKADSDAAELTAATTFATVWYVVPYRVLPPVLTWALSSLKARTVKTRVVDGLIAILTAAMGPVWNGYVLTTAAHMGSIISYLVPSYWINRSDHSQAECQHALDFQKSPNTTQDISCYRRDAEKQIFKDVNVYAFCVTLGAYVVLPVVMSMIMQCIKKPAENAPLVAPDAVVTGAIATGLADGLANGANMGGGEHPFLDASVLLPISLFLIPLWGWLQLGDSDAECKYHEQFKP